MQLIVRGVVDLTHNSDLFTSILDMLAVLIHSTLINDRDSNDKSNNNGDRGNNSGASGSNTNASIGPNGTGNQTPDRVTGCSTGKLQWWTLCY